MKNFFKALLYYITLQLVQSDNQCEVCLQSMLYNSHHCIVCIDICKKPHQFKNCQETDNNNARGEASCLQYCCGVSQQTFSIANFETCLPNYAQYIDTPTKQQIKILLICAGLILPAILVAVIICCVCCRSKKKIIEPEDEKNQSHGNKYQKQKKEQVSVQMIDVHQMNHFSLGKPMLGLQHTSNQLKQQTNQNSKVLNCSICSAGDINCIAGCNHGFHLKCLQNWFNKNQLSNKCPHDNIHKHYIMRQENDEHECQSGSQSPKDQQKLRESNKQTQYNCYDQPDRHELKQVFMFCQKCKKHQLTISLKNIQQNNQFLQDQVCRHCSNKKD